MKSRRNGYSLIEVLLSVGLMALLLGSVLVALQGAWSDVDAQWQAKTIDSLNLSMDAYRGYLARGYQPTSPWSATDASGVLAELAKPLAKDGVQVVVMNEATMVPLSKLKIAPSDFTSNARWAAAP